MSAKSVRVSSKETKESDLEKITINHHEESEESV